VSQPDANRADQRHPYHRSIVSYVQRGERMTVGQQRAWDTRWPELGQDVKALPPGPLALDEWFGRSAPVLLEIGSGMGETTSQLAAAQPELNYLACEVYKPGLAQLILRADVLAVDSLRLLRGDAVTVLTDHLEPDSLHGVRLFFPDPWPKSRHVKRRLLDDGFAALVADRLADGGVLHVATDVPAYARQAAAVLAALPLMEPAGTPWRPQTRFERRGLAAGRPVQDLAYRRVRR